MRVLEHFLMGVVEYSAQDIIVDDKLCAELLEKDNRWFWIVSERSESGRKYLVGGMCRSRVEALLALGSCARGNSRSLKNIQDVALELAESEA